MFETSLHNRRSSGRREKEDVGKPEGKMSLRRRRRWKDDIKIDIKEI